MALPPLPCVPPQPPPPRLGCTALPWHRTGLCKQGGPPQGGDAGPRPPVQGQGVLGSAGLSRASGPGSRPEKGGQLWGTGPRSAGTAAITSGLGRAARGAEPGLMSRPGTRAGAGAADAAAGAARARPRPGGGGEPGGRGALGRGGTGGLGRAGQRRCRTEQACLPSFLGATRRSN